MQISCIFHSISSFFVYSRLLYIAMMAFEPNPASPIETFSKAPAGFRRTSLCALFHPRNHPRSHFDAFVIIFIAMRIHPIYKYLPVPNPKPKFKFKPIHQSSILAMKPTTRAGSVRFPPLKIV